MRRFMTPHFDSFAVGQQDEAEGNQKVLYARERVCSGGEWRSRLTSKVRISCCVRSLDAAHLVRSPCKLEMEISIMFWMSSH